MTQKLTPQAIRNIGVYGLIREAEVDNSLIPDGAVTDTKNFHFDRRGAATVRPGVKNIAQTNLTYSLNNGSPVYSLFNAQSTVLLGGAFDTSPAATLFVFNNATGTVATLATLQASSSTNKIRFVDFSGFTMVMNGTYDSLRVNTTKGSYGSNSFVATNASLNPDQLTDTASGQLRPKFGDVYKSRMYVAGDANYTSRLFFSGVVSSSGTIKWSPGTDFVDINPGDGENITGIKRFGLELEVFKPNYIYRFRTAGTDPDPLIKVGTRSQESIIEGRKGLYFHHDTGFYRYSSNYPERISGPIQDIVQAIPFTQYPQIVSWKDDDHIYWSIGTVTVQETNERITYKNAVVFYSEASDNWGLYTYPSEVTAASPYVFATGKSIILGFNNGILGWFNFGSNDIGEPIGYSLRTKWYEIDGLSTRKFISDIMAISEKALGMTLMYQVDNEISWTSLAQLNPFLSRIKKNTKPFHRIRFKVNGVSTSEPAIFRGLEILDGLNEGVINNEYSAS